MKTRSQWFRETAFLSVVLPLLLSVSTAGANRKPPTPRLSKCPDGASVIRETVDSHKLQYCSVLSNDHRIRHGPLRVLDRRGRVIESGQYDNGIPVGTWVATGPLESEFFLQGRRDVAGGKVEVQYHTDGAGADFLEYYADKRKARLGAYRSCEGGTIRKSMESELWSKSHIQALTRARPHAVWLCAVGEWSYWHPNGKLAAKGSYLSPSQKSAGNAKGRGRVGVWHWWRKNGRFKEARCYHGASGVERLIWTTTNKSDATENPCP